MLCFTPLVLTGYLFTVQTSWHKTESVDAPSIEVQTCEQGIGAHVKASGTGLYGAGLHYGFTKAFDGHWTVTFQPKAGLSYSDRPRRELPSQTQFEVGAQLLVGYDRFRVGVEYWHLSNAGMKMPNIGMDMIGVTTGWVF